MLPEMLPEMLLVLLVVEAHRLGVTRELREKVVKHYLRMICLDMIHQHWHLFPDKMNLDNNLIVV